MNGRSDTIRVFAWPDHPLPSDDSLDLVAGAFGMEVVVSDSWLGAISIYYTGFVVESNHAGLATGPTCSPHIVMSPMAEQIVLAHEIGHTLGLSHVGTPKNLMNIDDMDFSLEDGQVDTARYGAWIMEQCQE